MSLSFGWPVIWSAWCEGPPLKNYSVSLPFSAFAVPVSVS